MTSASREIRLSSGTIRYREDGPPDGPVLVFVHGFLVDGLLWRDVVPDVSRWARCIVPDWPLGSHTIPMDDDADLSLRGVAALVAELLEALDLRDVTVVGSDSGGAITQVLVTEHPERIARFVLPPCDAFENCPPKFFKPLMTAARGPKSVLALLSGMRSASMRRAPFAFGWLSKKGIPDDITEAWVTPALTDAKVRRDIAKFARGLDPAVTLDAAAKLASTDRPGLIVWAREDKFFPVEHGERLARIIPDSRLEILDDCLCFVSEDQPGTLAALLAEFAGSQSAGKVPAGSSPG